MAQTEIVYPGREVSGGEVLLEMPEWGAYHSFAEAAMRIDMESWGPGKTDEELFAFPTLKKIRHFIQEDGTLLIVAEPFGNEQVIVGKDRWMFRKDWHPQKEEPAKRRSQAGWKPRRR